MGEKQASARRSVVKNRRASCLFGILWLDVENQAMIQWVVCPERGGPGNVESDCLKENFPFDQSRSHWNGCRYFDRAPRSEIGYCGWMVIPHCARARRALPAHKYWIALRAEALVVGGMTLRYDRACSALRAKEGVLKCI